MKSEQEIQEAAENHSDKVNGVIEDHFKARSIIDFYMGAKWMQEQDNKQFSLDDMRKAWRDGWQQKINERYDESDRTFEQFIEKLSTPLPNPPKAK